MNMHVSEEELQAKAVAPRVTYQSILDRIAQEHYFVAADGLVGAYARKSIDERQPDLAYATSLELLTFCVLVLDNGYTVVGKSACADHRNFDEKLGQKIAKDDAIEQMWGLLGFELKTKLALMEQGTESSLYDMTTHVGTKVVHAKPMSRGDYNTFRGWGIPADEDPCDEGYLVEYADGGQANVAGFTGYVSWSPKDVFERAYGKPIK